jgi:hypothetical protein
MPNSNTPGASRAKPAQSLEKKPPARRGGAVKHLAPVLTLVPANRAHSADELKEMNNYANALLCDIGGRKKVVGVAIVYETQDGELLFSQSGLYKRDPAHCAGILHALTTRITDQLGGYKGGAA